MMCIITKNVSLLPWVVCVSGISSYFDDGSQRFCYCGSRWWDILKLSYEQQRCHSSITSDWWTIYICEFSVSGWRPSSRHLYCLRSEMLLLQLLLMEHFSSSIHDPPYSSFATWSTITLRRDDEDFHIKIAAETLNRDWQHFESFPRSCITLWTIIIDYL